ncbi:SH3 domain-containing kinase-binding protein 1 [Aplochiton taeniatus]
MVEAVVEFDYQAQQEDELSLAVGDVILHVRKDDGGWWEGELAGRRGLFPDNFVREIKVETKREAGPKKTLKSDLANGSATPLSEPSVRPARKGEQIRKRRCKAAFSYAPQNEDELELKIGDVIEIIGEVEEGWWEGSLGGKTGMFPSNFTQDVQDGPPPLEEPRRRTSKESPGSESDGVDGRSDMGSGKIQPKKVRGFGFGDIFKDQPIKLRPHSVDMDPEGEKVPAGKPAAVAPETMKADADSKPKARELCKVIFPYDGQNEDELTIKEGETVGIISKDCADAGWWMGEIGGRQGVFPDNFVKLLIPEVEKERPKKPPPPSTPSIKEKKSEVKKVPPERPEHLPHRDQERGEEVKVGEIPKPSLSFLPKKPLPPKTSSSSTPTRRPDRPERPPAIPCESPKSEGEASTPESTSDRSEDVDVDLDSVVSTERLAHPTALRPRVTDRRPRSQILSASSLSSVGDLLDSPVAEEEKKDKVALPPKPTSLLPPPNSPGSRPISPSTSSLSPSPEARLSPLTPPTLEELRGQLRELRSSVELLKSQHRQEMKQLASELDEEKRIRLGLQMEVEHIKKSLSK